MELVTFPRPAITQQMNVEYVLKIFVVSFKSIDDNVKAHAAAEVTEHVNVVQISDMAYPARSPNPNVIEHDVCSYMLKCRIRRRESVLDFFHMGNTATSEWDCSRRILKLNYQNAKETHITHCSKRIQHWILTCTFASHRILLLHDKKGKTTTT